MEHNPFIFETHQAVRILQQNFPCRRHLSSSQCSPGLLLEEHKLCPGSTWNQPEVGKIEEPEGLLVVSHLNNIPG